MVPSAFSNIEWIDDPFQEMETDGLRFYNLEHSAMWSAKKTRSALICFAALFESFVSASFLGVAQNTSQEATQHPLFIVRERVRVQPIVGSLPCLEGRVHFGLSYSVITVFTDGKGANVTWNVPPCSEPASAIGWTAPAYGETHNFALSESALAQLRNFLDLPEVERLRDFMNAGSGVGDYDIEIQRASGVQRIPVVSLMPEHDETEARPHAPSTTLQGEGNRRRRATALVP